MFTFNPAMAVDSDQMEDGDETFDTRNLPCDEEEDNIDVCAHTACNALTLCTNNSVRQLLICGLLFSV